MKTLGRLWENPGKHAAAARAELDRNFWKFLENSELYLLGDVNCDLLSQTPHANTLELLDIFDIYNLTQHLTEPTRVTSTSQSLLDLCITNTPDKIKVSDVLSLGISDHSLIYFVRKSTWQRQFSNSFTCKRHFKHFNDNEFLNDLNEVDWNKISSSDDPNVMWSMCSLVPRRK